MLTVEKINYTLPNNKALVDISFAINADEIVAIIGKSGAGKSTLLRLLSGVDQPSMGQIYVSATKQPIHSIKPWKRKIGMAFQEGALWPHLTVLQHIKYAVGCLPKPERPARIDLMIRIFSLTDLKQRKPSELSGGEQQRLGLARALSSKPQLVLLDEAFANIDVVQRHGIWQELIKLQTTEHFGIIFISHDIDLCQQFAKRLLVLQDGKLSEHSPNEISDQHFVTQCELHKNA